jgi:hypothetical protein
MPLQQLTATKMKMATTTTRMRMTPQLEMALRSCSHRLL